MKNYYFYSRVSTDKQDDSLDAQKAKAIAYAAARGVTIDERHIFTDPDTSGAIPFRERGGGQLLLNTIALARRLHPDSEHHLIITKLDRLGRSTLDLETTFQYCKASGIAIHIIDFGGDSINTMGLAGDLLMRILFAVAEFERGMIRSRVQDVITDRRSKGFLLGHCPFGWDSEDTGQVKPRTDRPILRVVPNPAEQQWLRQMAAWRAAGWSYHAIAQALNRAGVRTKRGAGLWQSGNVANVLDSRYTREFLAAPAIEQQAA